VVSGRNLFPLRKLITPNQVVVCYMLINVLAEDSLQGTSIACQVVFTVWEYAAQYDLAPSLLQVDRA
jgi:hypothetical protein